MVRNAFFRLFYDNASSSIFKAFLINCKFLLGQPNFGAIEIVWSTTPVTLKLEVRDIKGYPVTGVKFPLVELQSRGLMSSVKAGEYRRHCSLEVNLPWMIKYRLAIVFYCSVSGMLFLILTASTSCSSHMNFSHWLKFFARMPFHGELF